MMENPLHKQSEKACMCFKTRLVRTFDFTVLIASLNKDKYLTLYRITNFIRHRIAKGKKWENFAPMRFCTFYVS